MLSWQQTSFVAQDSVTVIVENIGSRPVADLQIEADIGEDMPIEVIIDYVPAKSSRRFTLNVEDGSMLDRSTLSVQSYREP